MSFPSTGTGSTAPIEFVPYDALTGADAKYALEHSAGDDVECSKEDMLTYGDWGDKWVLISADETPEAACELLSYQEIGLRKVIDAPTDRQIAPATENACARIEKLNARMAACIQAFEKNQRLLTIIRAKLAKKSKKKKAAKKIGGAKKIVKKKPVDNELDEVNVVD